MGPQCCPARLPACLPLATQRHGPHVLLPALRPAPPCPALPVCSKIGQFNSVTGATMCDDCNPGTFAGKLLAGRCMCEHDPRLLCRLAQHTLAATCLFVRHLRALMPHATPIL